MALFGVNPGEYLDYVIVGLGNPGECYEYTIHNIGFKFIDYLQAQTDTNRGCKRKLHYSLVDKCVLNNNVVYMVKPQTYMNNSGMAVQDILRYYKLKPAKLIVLHDDIKPGIELASALEGGFLATGPPEKSLDVF